IWRKAQQSHVGCLVGPLSLLLARGDIPQKNTPSHPQGGEGCAIGRKGDGAIFRRRPEPPHFLAQGQIPHAEVLLLPDREEPAIRSQGTLIPAVSPGFADLELANFLARGNIQEANGALVIHGNERLATAGKGEQEASSFPGPAPPYSSR